MKRDENALVAAIRDRLELPGPSPALIANGHDAAHLKPLARGAVVSVDACVEGVHFERAWCTLADVGFRSYVAALSDLAAMAAEPVSGLLSLVLPSTMHDDDIFELIDGVAQASQYYKAPVLGGNVSRGDALVLSSTVIGHAASRTLTRAGANVGEAVYVTGTVGAASLGWRALERGMEESAFTERWRRPRARFDLVRQLLDVATSCIDVSDGVLADARHLANASGHGLALAFESVPTEDGHHALAEQLGESPLQVAWTGGEDYELLFTAPLAELTFASKIGDVVPGAAGVRLFDENARDVTPDSGGYSHF